MKKILFNYTDLLDRKEMPYQLLVARNYCIQQLNKREGSFLEELFALYQLEIELELIAFNGQIPAATYKNIAQLSLLLKRYDWLEQFLHKYQNAVEEGSYFFNLAILRFTQTRFEEALQLFEQADDKEVLINLSVKTWQLKTHFELWQKYPEDFTYEETLDAYLTAFTTFLNRKKLRLPKHYMYHLNFGKFVRELLRHSRPYSRNAEQLKKLSEKVTANEHLADRGWLISKLEKLQQ